MTRDLRKYARNTNIRLFAGFFLLLFIVGDGLIYLIYGREGAILGLICLVAGLAPLVLIALLLFALEWIVKRANDQ
ncbi:MAG TPA: hypothetical protein DEH25_06560 [Chloroflexi bacterium]|nr:hypothetical protein [Chloroflexota bacterium]HBY07082.1 hypothetical protein [Chloroflexota bacterium]